MKREGVLVDAPLGTSGWFLGSMAQWDLYLREGCEVSAVATPIDNDPEVGSGDTEDDTEPEDVGGSAAYIRSQALFSHWANLLPLLAMIILFCRCFITKILIMAS